MQFEEQVKLVFVMSAAVGLRLWLLVVALSVLLLADGQGNGRVQYRV